MRRAARVDANQSEIVRALRRAGASVQHLHDVGKGCPDLLVGWRGRNFLLEVKTPTGSLTQDQDDWMQGWQGQAAVVCSVSEALALLRRGFNLKGGVS